MNARKAIIALGMIALFGVIRWPLESAQTADWKARHVLPPDMGLSLREQLSQNSYAAALGGARSFIASIWNLRAFVAWEEQNWGAVEQRFRLVQELQPRVPSYWEMGAWHMAYNASGWYMYDWKGPKGENDQAGLKKLRTEMRERYIQKGLEMFARGIQVNPESWRLCEQAALLAGDPLKLPDRRLSSHYFAMAAALPDAPERIRRFEAYELSYLPDQRDLAYTKLKALYDEGPEQHLPTLLSTLFDLQLERGLPESERLPTTVFGDNPRAVYEQLRNFAEFRKSRRGTVSSQFLAYLNALEDQLNLPMPERLAIPEENVSQ